MTHHLNTKKGFTLIELLVVISIIGLLSSVVLSSLASAREKAYDARTQAELAQIHIILEEFYSEYGGYPYPGPDNYYCLGSSCIFADDMGGEILSEFAEGITFNQPKKLDLLASVGIPAFNSSRTITIEGLDYAGYAYFPCTDPVESDTAPGVEVCTGESGQANSVEVATGKGYISSEEGFRFTDGVADGSSGDDSGSGSDTGSSEDSGSPSGSGYTSDDSGSGISDADLDGIADDVDNCPNEANAGQEDSDGFEDGYGYGDACEDHSGSSDSGYYSS